MAKAKYTEASVEVADVVNRLYNAFPERFLTINRSDLYLVFKDAEKNAWEAKTNITNGLYRAITKKKIIIQLHKQAWELCKGADRALLLFRELSRIGLNQKDNSEYRLRRPDLVDFSDIVRKIGLDHEHKEEFFSKVVPVEAK